MLHYFNPDVATELGIAPAVVLQCLFYWTEKNRNDGKNFRDGHFWTYNSVEAFCKIFPYLSPKQIRTALSKLKESGYIVTGNYNKASFDRTTWYAVTEKGTSILSNNQVKENSLFAVNGNTICPVGQMEMTQRANDICPTGQTNTNYISNILTNEYVPPNGGARSIFHDKAYSLNGNQELHSCMVDSFKQPCIHSVDNPYTRCLQNVSNLETKWNQNVSKMDTQVSIDRDSIDQEREYPPDGGAHALDSDTPKRETRKKYGQYKRVLLSGKEYSSLLTELGEQELDRCIAYLDESAEMTDNKNRWKNWVVVIRKCSREKWGEVAKVPGKTEPTKNRFADYV